MTTTTENKVCFYRIKDIIGDRKNGIPAMLPISKEAWYQGIRDGRYPRPVKLAPKTSAWRRTDIESLVERLNEGRWNEKVKEG